MNRSESRYFATAARMDEAFLTLLAKKDFEYITVKEICEVAEVNRSTFYLHYETMSDFHYICYRCDSAVCKNATKRNNERCLINSSLSIQSSKNAVFSRLFAYLMFKPYVFSLVFALMSRNKGNFFILRRLLYPSALRKYASLPL